MSKTNKKRNILNKTKKCDNNKNTTIGLKAFEDDFKETDLANSKKNLLLADKTHLHHILLKNYFLKIELGIN